VRIIDVEAVAVVESGAFVDDEFNPEVTSSDKGGDVALDLPGRNAAFGGLTGFAWPGDLFAPAVPQEVDVGELLAVSEVGGEDEFIWNDGIAVFEAEGTSTGQELVALEAVEVFLGGEDVGSYFGDLGAVFLDDSKKAEVVAEAVVFFLRHIRVPCWS